MSTGAVRRRRRGGRKSAASVYEALLGQQYAAGLIYRMDTDPGSHVATDLSGNGRNGQILGGPATADPGNLGGATSLRLDGVDDRVQYVYAGTPVDDWLGHAQDFTMTVLFNPTDLAAQKELMGRPQTYQVWLEVSGKLTVYMSPPWTSFSSVASLIAGNLYLLTLRKDSIGGKFSIWINGTKDAEAAHGAVDQTGFNLAFGYSSTGPRYAKGVAGYGAWTPVALTDAQILAAAQAAGLHA